MKNENQDRKVYETPEIVYEGTLSTRAGSPSRPSPDDAGGLDLFGNDQ